MENKIKISFWLYKAKKNSKNLVPVYMRIWCGYQHFNRATGLFVKETDWDRKSNRVKGTNADAHSLNAQIEGLRHKVIQITNQLMIQGKPFSVEIIQKILDGEDSSQRTLLKIFDEHLKMMNILKGKEFAPQTIIKYANTRLRVSQYLKSRYKSKDIFMHELNYDFIKGFEIFLRDKFEQLHRYHLQAVPAAKQGGKCCHPERIS
jgi:hypothetical protein